IGLGLVELKEIDEVDDEKLDVDEKLFVDCSVLEDTPDVDAETEENDGLVVRAVVKDEDEEVDELLIVWVVLIGRRVIIPTDAPTAIIVAVITNPIITRADTIIQIPTSTNKQC